MINVPRARQSGYAVLPLSRPHDDDSIRSAEASIERNFKRPLRVEDLARERRMSARNFIRRFKTATGRTPGDYLQATRIAVAKQLLESGARSVQTVSEVVGYENAAFFRALFKRHTGMSPAEYRENFGATVVAARRSRWRGGCPRCPATGSCHPRRMASSRCTMHASAPAIAVGAATAYSSLRSTLGTSTTSRSRAIPAADAREHAEQDRATRSQPVCQGLAGTGDGEQSEPDRVEQLYRIAQSLDVPGKIERGETGEHRHREVAPVRKGGGRRGADQGIARDAAGRIRCKPAPATG